VRLPEFKDITMSNYKRWTVRSVPVEVIKEFKLLAVENDTTIASCLTAALKSWVSETTNNTDSDDPKTS
jgi:hypothetical protein